MMCNQTVEHHHGTVDMHIVVILMETFEEAVGSLVRRILCCSTDGKEKKEQEWFDSHICLLMLVAQQVVDSLYRIERAERNLYEDCALVAHGTIPQTW